MKKILDKITENVKQNKKIIIASHKDMDLDAIGSSLCLYKIVEQLNKDPYILIDTIKQNQTLEKSIQKIKEKKIKINFIEEKAIKKYNPSETLVIILDTNKKGLIGSHKLIDYFNKIIVIDHHIQSEDFIPNTIFTYINNNTSSATEIMYYYLKYLKFKIDPIIATIMLAGIEVDTNGFNIKTNAKTFQTAAALLQLGADNIEKQELLKENKENYCKRQEFIKNSYMINKKMALCMMDKNIYEKYQLALISEDLLQFDDVEASFTIGYIESDTIGISARSIGKIDVEKIMRSLGGGGHQTDAACAINSNNLEEVKQQLLKKIEVKL